MNSLLRTLKRKKKLKISLVLKFAPKPQGCIESDIEQMVVSETKSQEADTKSAMGEMTWFCYYILYH